MISGTDCNLAGRESLRAGQEALCKDPHQHPERSHAEHRIARRVAEQLQDAEFTLASGTGGTAVADVLANGRGPAVLLHCERDALPLQEATGAPYATATAPDACGQQVPADHACDHDLNMAAMTGVATLIAARRDRWHGTLIILFQPAEETSAESPLIAPWRARVTGPEADNRALRQRNTELEATVRAYAEAIADLSTAIEPSLSSALASVRPLR